MGNLNSNLKRKDDKIKTENSDAEVLEQIKNGNKEFLEILYERYATKIYRKCIGLTHDEIISKDLTHDIFIKIITKLHTFKGNSKFSLWVHSITHNHCINFLKKEQRTKFEELDVLTEDNLSLREIEAQHKELLQIKASQLMQLMKKLNPREKEVLLLHYQDELSVKEISITLNISESATKMRLKRSRDKLAYLFNKKQ